ncbi:hypothetical protein AgCh_018382 [Apium graveolens]
MASLTSVAPAEYEKSLGSLGSCGSDGYQQTKGVELGNIYRYSEMIMLAIVAAASGTAGGVAIVVSMLAAIVLILLILHSGFTMYDKIPNYYLSSVQYYMTF